MKSPKDEKARLDKVTVQAITDVAQGIETKIAQHGKPEVSFPVRSLSNVRYDPKKGFFEIGKGKSVRTLTVNTAKTFADRKSTRLNSSHERRSRMPSSA